MPDDSNALPDDDVPEDPDEFVRRLENDPAFAARMRAEFEAALAAPPTPETEHLYPGIREVLESLKHVLGRHHGMQKLLELRDLAGDYMKDRDPDRLRRMNVLVDEAVDYLLDVDEPDRTRLMKMVTEIQADLRRWRGV